MADPPIRILITGFGTVSQAHPNIINPSFEILKQLPTSLPGIEILAHPSPLRSTYRWLLQESPRLIEATQPDIVLHIGVDVERQAPGYYSLERSAARDGYHEYPDLDRQTLMRNETQKKLWGKKSAERLDTSLDLDAVVEACRVHVQRSKVGKMRPAVRPDVRATDDVGSYVCGLLYYATLAELERRSPGRREVIFLHVLMLAGEKEVGEGVAVVMGLMQALGEVWTRSRVE